MKSIALTAALALGLTACASAPDTEADSFDVYDPYEGWNRRVFAFNEAVDKAAIEPAAKAYRAATPKVARRGVSNVLSNLNAPVVFANDILQGQPGRAGATFSRFAVNSTFGLGGLIDVAEMSGLEGHTEDFGQTLAVWGMEPGPFLVLPLAGPSNARDLIGVGVDTAFDPLVWVDVDHGEADTPIAVTRGALGALSVRERLIETFDTLREQPEPYIAYRRAYTTQREAAIRNGAEDPDQYKDLPDFDDSFDFEDEDDL